MTIPTIDQSSKTLKLFVFHFISVPVPDINCCIASFDVPFGLVFVGYHIDYGLWIYVN